MKTIYLNLEDGVRLLDQIVSWTYCLALACESKNRMNKKLNKL